MTRKTILKVLAWLLPACFFLLSGAVRAEGPGPDELVKDVTEEVLNILRQDKDIQSGNTQRAIALIEKKVAPHFDFQRMTRLAVGRAWQRADDQQREALVREFHTLLVRTYANSLTTYRNQTVSFRPSAKKGGDEVVVRSQINKPGARPIMLEYSLANTGGGWKVFDVVVANVSLVNNYRGSFASEVERGGVDGLIRTLQEKNQQGISDKPPVSRLDSPGRKPTAVA